MVTFTNIPDTLNAYSDVPLTPNLLSSVQHAFFDGSLARFQHPSVVVPIHDRPDFHGQSHQNIRNMLDSEGLEDEFALIDNTTLSTNSVWFIESTDDSLYDTEEAIKAGYPPVTYPHEDSTLWQIRVHTVDVPYCLHNWNNNNGSAVEWLRSRFQIYDPHDAQMPPFTRGLNWTDKSILSTVAAKASILAEYWEFEWSTRLEDTSNRWPAVVRLTESVAMESGLLQKWEPWPFIPVVNVTIGFDAPWDWDSPIWPPQYPDPGDGCLQESLMKRDGVNKTSMTQQEGCLNLNSLLSNASGPRPGPQGSENVASDSQMTQRSLHRNMRRQRRFLAA
ncbi:uncharacterized protein KY384_000422 [Bacidia gigantensis]|uniref:uncharacterized protein n=1 Tax=Bacidia gigantensis TaxID=2732470 RepID=UPI001D057539|nr:uncharacterized protein KY384_000422 [Bacidia gigantensis]KAG8525662.1 hypothetical protein KY384_000422 [Bacidia gigantensis]